MWTLNIIRYANSIQSNLCIYNEAKVAQRRSKIKKKKKNLKKTCVCYIWTSCFPTVDVHQGLQSGIKTPLFNFLNGWKIPCSTALLSSDSEKQWTQLQTGGSRVAPFIIIIWRRSRPFPCIKQPMSKLKQTPWSSHCDATGWTASL